jgi:hypothetical protein
MKEGKVTIERIREVVEEVFRENPLPHEEWYKSLDAEGNKMFNKIFKAEVEKQLEKSKKTNE